MQTNASIQFDPLLQNTEDCIYKLVQSQDDSGD